MAPGQKVKVVTGKGKAQSHSTRVFKPVGGSGNLLNFSGMRQFK